MLSTLPLLLSLLAVNIVHIEETLAYLADLADERKEEHAAFQKAKKDDQDAIALLEKAKQLPIGPNRN